MPNYRGGPIANLAQGGRRQRQLIVTATIRVANIPSVPTVIPAAQLSIGKKRRRWRNKLFSAGAYPLYLRDSNKDRQKCNW